MNALKKQVPSLPKNPSLDFNYFKLMIQSPEGKRFEYYFQQSQVLVGRSDACDLSLKHELLSFYHAIFLVAADSLLIIDINSENGVIVNGSRTHRQLLSHGDVLNLGAHIIYVEHRESSQDSHEQLPPKFSNLNEKTELLKDAPPPLPVLRSQKHREHLALIDGEWCDIKFLDDQYVPQEHSPIGLKQDRFKDYIDTEEKLIHHLLPENKRKLNDAMIEIMVLSHGNIIFFESYPVIAKVIHKIEKFIPQDLKLWNIPWKDILEWDVANEKLQLKIPSGWESEGMSEWMKSKSLGSVPCDLKHTEWSVNRGVQQIVFKYSPRVSKMGALRFWHGREDFFRASRNAMLLFLPFLFLLLVEIPVMEEPPVEEVVIFKPEILKETIEPTVVRPSASAGQDPKPQENSLAQSQKEDRSKSETQANPNNQQAQEVPKENVPKINLAGQFKGLLGDKIDLSNKEVESNSEKKKSSANGAIGALGVSKGKLETTGGGSLKGLATSGELSGKGGFKGKGQGKSEFDSHFTATKTVVLGSIDPELLRKILREYIPQFRYCYQNELSHNAQLGGIIDLNFSLNGEGKVTSSKVLSKTGSFSDKGINCIDGVLKSIPFPKPKGGGRVDVKQPLNFTSEKNKIN